MKKSFIISILTLLIIVFSANSQNLFFDNFEDGDWTSNPAWTSVTGYGVEMVASGYNNSDWCVEVYENSSPNVYGTLSVPFETAQAFEISYYVKRRTGQNNHNYFQAIFTNGEFVNYSGFYIMFGHLQQSTITVWMDGTLLEEVPVTFGDDWTFVKMIRDESGTWDIYWDDETTPVLTDIQDSYGQLDECYFTMMGVGQYNEGGVLFDDVLIDYATEYLTFDDFEDGDWTSNPAWTSVTGYGVEMVASGYNNSDWCVEVYENSSPNVYGTLSVPFETAQAFEISYYVKRRTGQNNHNYFQAIFTNGEFVNYSGFYIMFGHLQQSTITVWMDGTLLEEVPVTFGDDWTFVKMIRDESGTWDIYWDDETTPVLTDIQDSYGQLDECYFTMMGVGQYNEGGVLFDDVCYVIPPNSIISNNHLQTIPWALTICKSFPNPFNPTTELTYTIPASGEVSLTIYDIQGREVDVLLGGYQSSGEHSIVWDAKNLPSGIYFARLSSTNGQTQTRKLVLMK